MIQDGVITPEDGVRLLDALGGEKTPAPPPPAETPTLGTGARWLRVPR